MKYFVQDDTFSLDHEAPKIRDHMSFKDFEIPITSQEYLNMGRGNESLPNVLDYIAQKIEDLHPNNSDANPLTSFPGSNHSEEQHKMMEKSKRIIKREKAKTRKASKNQEASTNNSNNELNDRIALEVGTLDNMDDKSKKKKVQMIRNRISAQNSRDRKKAYIFSLESENADLREEKAKLLARIAELEAKGISVTGSALCRACGAGLEPSTEHSADMDSDGAFSGGLSPISRGYFTLLSVLSVFVIVALVSVKQGGSPADAMMMLQQPNHRLLTGSEVVLANPEVTKNAQGNYSPPPVSCDPKYQFENKQLWTKFANLKKEFDEKMKQCGKCLEKNHSEEAHVKPTANKKFLSADNNKQLATLDYYSPPKQATSSLFCPSGIIIEPANTATQMNNPPLTNLANSQWLQVFLPKQNLSHVGGPADVEQPMFVVKQEEGEMQDEDETSGKMLELICKIQNVREVTM